MRLRHAAHAALASLSLFVAMLVFLEIGRRFGRYELRTVGEGARVGVGVIDGAVFALLGLLLGFSFSGAAARFDKRRELVAEEVNAIGTAWQRIDLLVAGQQQALRPVFVHYVDELLDSYAEPKGAIDPLHETPSMAEAGRTLWTDAIDICMTKDGERARLLLLPSLTEMFGAVERERLARRIHPPPVIFAMLGLTAIAAALFGGYGMANAPTRNWLYTVGVSLTISLATYVILELEYPRLGLVRIDAMDRALAELRETFTDS